MLALSLLSSLMRRMKRKILYYYSLVARFDLVVMVVVAWAAERVNTVVEM